MSGGDLPPTVDASRGDAASGPPRKAGEVVSGQRIGNYKILDLVSRGGMGEVYLAVREYEEFEKRVALKLLQPDMEEHEDILRRFRTEHRILGSLDHPNIARLLDGGTTESGRPYFVMEYVDGEPIDHYCDSRRLSIRERLGLFLDVCAAVEFAHRNTVVHRDIKPANILVTADGTAKLLDFGIAKLLNPELSGRSIAPTRLRVWTPEYASPEQVKGEQITTASDVYSLGVLLYELVTGHQPFQGPTPPALDRAILEQDPEKPSTKILRRERLGRPDGPQVELTPETVSGSREGDPKKLRRRLAGDVDNIVLMALRKEPQRRYGSVDRLAADIRRHLDGHPVTARGDSIVYRAGKFVRRHRFGVVAAALFVLALIAFAIVMTVQRGRLAAALAGEEMVTEFLVDLFEVSDPLAPQGDALTARDLLDRGRDRLASQLADRPEVQARLLATVGSIYGKLGDYGEAERQLRQAVEVRRRLAGGAGAELAADLNELAEAVRAQGRHDEAEALVREALAMRRELFGERHPAVAESRNDLASLLRFRGELDAAEEHYRQALEVFRSADRPGETANTLNNLANLLQGRGQLDAAEAMYRESLAIRRRVLGPQHPMVANSLHNLAALLQDIGRRDAAEPLYREALAILRQRLGDRHPWVAINLVAHTSLLLELEDFEPAEHEAREALAILHATLPAGHWQIHSADSLHGACLTALGRHDEAEPVLRASYEALKAQLGEASRHTGKARERLAAHHRAVGRPDLAAELAAAGDGGP